MSDRDSLDLPRDLGPYVLLRRLAVGGMAEVYVAKKQGIVDFEKYVAIKVIHPRYSEDEHFVKLLVEEAKIAVQLGHVNIAQIFDLGVADGVYYIAMEYVEGVDAYRLMRRASEHKLPMPIDVCVHTVAEVCNGLDYAHRKRDGNGKPLGIVHRDVSPQNVLVSFAGEVKIVDFGIAKAALREGQTEAGVIKGKYYYMSPEQAWGDPMDHRTDVFSTGVVLYELLTGEMMYREDNVPLLLDKVRKAEVSRPEKKRPDLPRELGDIVMKALAKEPADRFQSAHEMAQALVQFLYRVSPSFTATRVVELMARLFPNEIKVASAASGMKVEPPRPAPKPKAPPKPAATPLVEEDGDDATRNDLPPFKRGSAAVAAPEAPAPAPPVRPAPPPTRTAPPLARPRDSAPSWGDDEDDETNVVGGDDWDDDSTTVDDAAGVMAKLESLYGSKAKRAAAAKAAATGPAGKPRPAPVEVPRVPEPAPAPPSAPAMPARPRVSAAPPVPAPAPQPPPRPRVSAAPAPQAQYAQPPPQQQLQQLQPFPTQPPQSFPPQQPQQMQSLPPQPAQSLPPQPAQSFPPQQPQTFSQPPQAPGMPWPASPPDPFAPPPTGAAPAQQGGQRAIPTSVYAAQPGAEKSPWPRIVGLAALLVVVVTGVAIWLVLDPGTEPSPGVIEVVSVPAGAHLRIDGRDIAGATPLRVRDTPGTPHARRLEVTLEGYSPWSGELLPKQDEIVTQVVVLTRLAVQLRIDSNPPGATLRVGATAVGVAPLDVQVPPGPLEVRAVWANRPEVRQMVDVQPGGPAAVTITAPQ